MACNSEITSTTPTGKFVLTPFEAVAELEREHILYVMEAMQRNTTQVANIRAYTLSALYNAPVTIGPYYSAAVRHDFR